MKTAISLLVCVLLLAPMAVAQPGGDNLIVPGVRVGKWMLQMTIGDLLRLNGSVNPYHVEAGLEGALDARRDYLGYAWQPLAFRADTFDRKKVERLVAGYGGGLVPFKTDRGITLLQSKRSDILKTYGKPTVTLRASYGQDDVVYDKIGLGFGVYHDGGAESGIRAIFVFRPGTAKGFWKF